MNAYERVQLARGSDRPTAQAYIAGMIENFFELSGDRRFGEDAAVITGIGRIVGLPITVLALEKGKDTNEKARRNFGSAHPEGYRKALRQMKLAEKFHRPILSFIDTAGAFCGIGAEERGQGQAIAENLYEMSTLKTPILSLLIGEGGSGGALALAMADEVWMMENAIYSVISPEGCASILFKDAGQVEAASESLKLTAQENYGYGLIDRVIPEAPDWKDTMSEMKQAIGEKLKELQKLHPDILAAKRYNRFRKIGGTA